MKPAKISLFIGALVILLGGVYFLSSTVTKHQPSEQITIINHPTPTSTNTKINPTPIALKETSAKALNFQNYLRSNCKKIDEANGGYFYGMPIQALPIIYDTSLYRVQLHDEETVSCDFGGTDKSNGFVSLNNNNFEDINIYDRNSLELGHGGPPYIESYGTVIENKDNLKISVYLGFSDGPNFIDDMRVFARGEKELLTTTGSVFVNFATVVIPANDSRLIELLNKYSKPSEFAPGKRQPTSEISMANEAIAKEFFSDPTNLKNSEREKLDYVRRLLNSVKFK